MKATQLPLAPPPLVVEFTPEEVEALHRHFSCGVGFMNDKATADLATILCDYAEEYLEDIE